MATLSSLTLDVLEMLYGMAQVERPTEDSLKTACVDAAADVTFQFNAYAMWKKGDYAEYWKGDGSEGEILILADDHPAAADATFRRAQRGTTGAAHAIADAFLHNPPYPVHVVQRWINNVIDTDLAPHVFYLSHRTLTFDPGKTWYPLTAGDFDVVNVFQTDLALESEIGTCTFANAGDLWTHVAHGLAVGDHVRFTAAGAAPVEYDTDVDYWVASIASADTFTLSATSSTTTLVGSADSVGTWTLERRRPSYHPFERATWEVVQPISPTTVASTGGILRLRSTISEDDPVNYVAKSKPSSGSISSLPADIVEMVPWGVCGKLLLGTRVAPPRNDPVRNMVPSSEGQTYRDYAAFMGEFLRLRKQYRMKMQRELASQQQRVFRPTSLWRG
jgi:hypothetical protein